MNYISVKEAAEQWKISERWVQKFCTQNRIPGVLRFGHSWMIPKDSVRPEDLRIKTKRKENDNA